MAQRILGMGDVLTLVEKAQEAFNVEEAEVMRRKIRKETFTLDDFLKQMKQMKKMGSIGKLMKFIPGLGQMMDQVDEQEMEKEMRHTEAVIQSMTAMERENPVILDGARRARIARGSGVAVPIINRLLKDFEMARKMMKNMMGGPKDGGMMAALAGGGRVPVAGHGAGKGKSKKNKKKKSR
jgi:signal recognition particle subunit SRP54